MSTSQPRTTSERSDDIPLIIYWLLQLKLAEVLDEVLPEPHGNRQGLSYGQLGVVLLSYIMTQADHRYCRLQSSSSSNQSTTSTSWRALLFSFTNDGTYPQFIEKLGTQSTYSLARTSLTQLRRV